MINQNTPYTYYLGWTDSSKKVIMSYYGVRYAKKCDPSDLWKTYFTSSKYVADYVKINGQPSIIKVRRIFTGKDKKIKAINWEHRVLRRMNVIRRSDYLNKHNNRAFDHDDPIIKAKRISSFNEANKKLEVKERRKLSALQAMNRPEVKQKLIIAASNPESKIKKSQSLKNTYKNPEVIKRLKKSLEHAYASNPEISLKRSGKNHGCYDHTVYTFEHASGIKEICTQYELCKKYKLRRSGLSSLISGRYKTTYGWKLVY